MPEVADLYEVLQVSPNAEPEVIEAAYRRLARKYHPDVAHTPEAADRMRQIARAYRVLSDPDRRAAYDPAWASRRIQEQFAAHQSAQRRRRAPGEPAGARSAALAWLAIGLAVVVGLVVVVPLVRLLALRPLTLALLVVGIAGIAWYARWLIKSGRV
jgi:hypothetical protein